MDVHVALSPRFGDLTGGVRMRFALSTYRLRHETALVSAAAMRRMAMNLRSGFAAIALIASVAVCRPLYGADASAAATVEPPTLKLPAGARPTRYVLTLTIVPGEAKAAGEIAIDVELDRPHSVLWLNAE